MMIQGKPGGNLRNPYYSFDRSVYERAAQKRRAFGLGLDFSIDAQQKPGTFAGDFKSLIPGWSFLVQSDAGIGATGSVVDTWTDQIGGVIGTAPTSGQKPIAIAGPNGRAAIQSVSGQNTAMNFAFAMPAPGTTPQWIYAVVRQDAWTLNGALFGSQTSEFTMRILQYDTSPKLALSNTATVSGPAVGSYGRLSALFTNSVSDRIQYGAAVTTGQTTGPANSPNTSICLFNHLGGALPGRFTICMFGIRPGAPTAPQLATLEAACLFWYGAGVEF